MTDATAPRNARQRGTSRRRREDRAARCEPHRRPPADGGVRYAFGPGLLRAVRGATANVERHVPELNALNVYPVPDGDTGINMIATMRAALAEVEALPPGRVSLGDLASAVAFGALMGARGNSGVILSQVFRGMADSLGSKDRADARDLARALRAGADTAYGAVARPVEGTILTVVRAAADAAEASAERGERLDQAMLAATQAAGEAVARTPDQLDVLRAAGVVDAGGQGLFRALEGALATIGSTDDLAITPTGVVPLGAADRDVGAPHVEPADLGAGTWGYETVYLLRGKEDLDLAAIRDRLESMGESVLVAGDARMVKVHVHNARPDEVIAYGLSLGSLTQITIQDLDAQTHEAGVAGTVAQAGRSDAAAGVGPRRPSDVAPRAIGVVAVAAGAGLAEIFASFGVEEILPMPRSGNPSTGEILAAVSRIPSRSVVVLPNDPNVVLAAEQAARTVRSKAVVVVPTRSAPEGYAALLALDQSAPVQANLAPMLAAARDVQTLLVAVADRSSRLAEHSITPGQFVVLRPGAGLAAVADDAVTAIDAAVATLDDGFELLTFYLGEGGTEAEARAAVERIGERRPGTEAEIQPGGQAHYRYLISAE